MLSFPRWEVRAVLSAARGKGQHMEATEFDSAAVAWYTNLISSSGRVGGPCFVELAAPSCQRWTRRQLGTTILQ